MYYCLWTTVRVFVSTVSEIKVYIYCVHHDRYTPVNDLEWSAKQYTGSWLGIPSQ